MARLESLSHVVSMHRIIIKCMRKMTCDVYLSTKAGVRGSEAWGQSAWNLFMPKVEQLLVIKLMR